MRRNPTIDQVFLAAVAGLILILAGCLHTKYEIEMQPRGDKLQRKISATSNLGPNKSKFTVPEDELNLLASAYQRPIPQQGMIPTTFERLFSVNTPQDVGGHGYYLNWDSDLGKTTAYLERFRGSDDFFEQLERRRKAIDQIVDLLLAWLEAELADANGFQTLKEFVNTQFRSDLHNVGVYGWHARSSSGKNDFAEKALRLGLYFAEREYFAPEHIAQFISLNYVDPVVAEERIRGMVKEVVARKTGIDTDEIEKQFPMLQSRARIEASLKTFIKTTPEFEHFVRDRENQDDDSRMEELFLGELLDEGFFGGEIPFLSSSDHVNSSLKSGVQPLFTNGTWNVAEQQIEWSFSIPLRDSKNREYADFCYAIWASPNEQSQITHFGKVILDGESLGQYCLWYQSLDEHTQNSWNRFVSRFVPGQQLTSQIREAKRQIGDLSEQKALEFGIEMIGSQLKDSKSNKD